MSGSSEIVYQGWLTKSPPSKGIFRPRWRRRWFVLRTGPFPNQFVLEYFTDESCRRQKGRINLDECEQLVGPLAVQDRHRFTFHIRTPSRTYYLAADSDVEMGKWIAGLCQVCGLKSMEEESEGTIVYSKAGDENNQPNMRQHHNNEDVTESDESSPSLSNKISGPYIPISECLSGKPIPKSDRQDVTYCNTTVFQFPPKVNWATHPVKRETDMDVGSTSSSVSKGQSRVAPPRPPKKGSSPAVSVTVSSPPVSADVLGSTGCIKSSITPFENDETLDSSSTCSSLHSPPGSAGVVYSNISDISDTTKTTTANLNAQESSSPQRSNNKASPSENNSVIPPPVVDRNLKPLRREGEPRTQTIQNSPTQILPSPSYNSGTRTLPSRNLHNNRPPTIMAGPVIDRTRKPSDGHHHHGPNHTTLALGPTPVQVKNFKGQSNHQSNSFVRDKMDTLPSSHRRTGPVVVSPNDKKPNSYFHEYEQAPDLKGTYLQIDCTKESESPKFPPGSKPSTLRKGTLGHHSVDTSGSVEYRLIDPVKTKALKTTIEDREKQLRSNPLNKNNNN